MTSEPTPSEYFTGIDFNPSFYQDTGTTGTIGLSETTVNALYLRKTVADTATAVETFNSGLKSSIYNSVAPSDNVALFTANTTGDINFATSSIRTPANPIDIGGINSLIRFGGTSNAQITTVDNTAKFTIVKSAQFEPGIPNGILHIASSQESELGVLNIGLSALRTGAINIATEVTGYQDINIASLSSTVQKININRPLTVKYANSTYATDLTQIGSEKTTFVNSKPMSSGAIVNLCSLLAVPIGRYMIYYYIENTIATNTVSFNPYEVGVTVSNASFNVIVGGMYQRENATNINRAIGIHNDFRCDYFNLTSSYDIYLVAKYTWLGTGTIATTASFKLVRIG